MEFRVKLMTKMATLDIACEDMCKRIGAYPDCQCAGFQGNPASDGDTRACIVKYCQDPATPCPTDEFVACVKSFTGLLQWESLLQRVDISLDSFKAMMIEA